MHLLDAFKLILDAPDLFSMGLFKMLELGMKNSNPEIKQTRFIRGCLKCHSKSKKRCPTVSKQWFHKGQYTNLLEIPF